MNSAILFSKTAEEELRVLSHSAALRNDMRAVATSRHNPFLKVGVVDADAYLEFVMTFNEFINHEPKPFKPMIGSDMRL
jgi:hypothetical protein